MRTDYKSLLFKVLFFNENCPNCDEPMKNIRKLRGDTILYTCFSCYKSWLKKDKIFMETKFVTR